MTTKKSGRKTEAKANGQADAVAMTVEEILSAKEPASIEVPILLKPHLQTELDAAQADLGKSELLGEALEKAAPDSPIRKAYEQRQDRVAKAKAEVEQWTRIFRFQACGRDRLEEMMMELPPSRDHIRQAREEARRLGQRQDQVPTWDLDRFPPALIAECSAEAPPDAEHPERYVGPMTVEQATQLWESDSWSRGELGLLWAAVFNLNQALG